MARTIKHTNIMALKDRGEQFIEIICRGCTMRGRENIWHGFVSSISGWINREIDNSYLTFEEEPSNEYDPNAIMVVCRGEFFGTAGYVGKEYTGQVKEILQSCRTYRIDMADENEAGNREIHLKVYWDGFREELDLVAERLKEMRKQKKLTQKQVQDLTGIDQSEQSKMEQGKRTPTLQQLAKLARLYETSMDFLAGETDVKTPYPPAKYDLTPLKGCQLDGEDIRYNY